jgi:hypothetical protein
VTRYNKASNPSAANDATGWRGAGTRARVTGLTGTPRATGVQVATTANAFERSVGSPAAACAPGQTWTGVCHIAHSVSRTVRVDLVRWNNGVYVGSTSVTDVTATSTFQQVRITATLPAGTYNEVTIHADVPGSGTAGNLTMSSARIEQVSDSTLVYGDGDDAASGWTWDGTAGNSTSTQGDAPVIPASEPAPAVSGIGSAGEPWRSKPVYDLVLVARVMHANAAPTFEEIDSLAWDSLTWVEELSRPGTLEATVPVATMPDTIRDRLRNPVPLPSELWLYRNSRRVFAGPWFGYNGDDSVRLQISGLLGYLRGWWLEADQAWTATDQFAIAKGLVDYYQALDYGNFGIDTSAIGTSGVTRDATYPRIEQHNIGQRLQELGERLNGFDISINPISRQLQLWYPQRGIDRSTGPEAVIFDARNVSSSNLVCSVAPGDIASEAYGSGGTTGTDTRIWSQKTNSQVRASFGRWGVAQLFDGVSEQTTLDAHTQRLVDSRSAPLFAPGPDAWSTPDSDLSGWDVGDTISYQLHQLLDVRGAFRVRKRTIKVAKDGTETVSPEFG